MVAIKVMIDEDEQEDDDYGSAVYSADATDDGHPMQ